MELKYERKGANRKPLIRAIEDVTGLKANYLKTPSMAYEIGVFRVSKDGTVTSTDDKSLKSLKEILAGDYGISLPEGAQVATHGLTVSLPKAKADLAKLEKILENKGDLIKKALGIESLEIQETDDKLVFAWFDEIDQDHMMTYTHFIAALCKMSLEAKRVNDTKKEIVNEKYAFRCFLLRLGFIGDEFKQDRKILLSYLEGSSAFRNGGRNDATSK